MKVRKLLRGVAAGVAAVLVAVAVPAPVQAYPLGRDVAWLQSPQLFTFQGSRALATVGEVDGIAVPTWAGVGDYNHDGRDDLYWYHAADSSIFVLLSNGTTFHSIGAARGPGIGVPDWAAVGDFDGNGYRDDIAWLEGDTLFTFSGSCLCTIGSLTGVGKPVWAGVGDDNHDGRDDLYWYPGNGDDTIYVLTSTGDSFESATSVRGPGIGAPQAAVVGDFNGDGWADDIAWLQTPQLFTFVGSCLCTRGEVDGIGSPVWYGAGDYNGDGRDDLFWYHADTNLYVLLSNGTTFHSIGAVRGPGIGAPQWAGGGHFTGN